MSIYKKLAEAKKEIGKISKDQKNPHFKNTYFDINKLIEEVEPILQKHGLLLLQPIQSGGVNTMIIDNEGNNVESFMALPDLVDPQKMGSAITYYRRYTLQSLLALQAEDDDGNTASGHTKNEVEKPWLNQFRADKKTPSPQWHNLLQAIADGKITSLNQVRDVYKVSKTTAAEIEKALS